MGEAALSYWLEEYICPTENRVEDEQEDVTYLATGETDNDWKFGSD